MRSRIIAAVEKQQVLYLSVCVCVRACARALIVLHIQQATRMGYIVTSFMAPQTPPHFSTLSHTRCDFRGKKYIEDIMCGFIFPTTFVKTFPIIRKIWRYIIKNVETSLCKVPVTISDFNEIMGIPREVSCHDNVS
jgi:hypothetical protein